MVYFRPKYIPFFVRNGINKSPRYIIVHFGMFVCEKCNKQFAEKRYYTKHCNTASHKNKMEGSSVYFKCVCGKTFAFRSGLYRHKKKCEGEPAISSELTELRNEITQLKKERGVSSISHQTTNHHTTNNITIHVNPFGKENIETITPDYFLHCLNKVYASSPMLAEKIYSIPENQNVTIPNKKQPYVTIQTEDGEELAFADEVLDKMESFCYTLLEEKFTDPQYRRKMSTSKQNAYQGYIHSYENDEKGTIRKNIRNSLKLMLLNLSYKRNTNKSTVVSSELMD